MISPEELHGHKTAFCGKLCSSFGYLFNKDLAAVILPPRGCGQTTAFKLANGYAVERCIMHMLALGTEQ
jgi:hypothetical protein